MIQPSTVQEIIDKLKTLPPDAPCFVRPKYSGPLETYVEAAVSINGISEMHPPSGGKIVMFLV